MRNSPVPANNRIKAGTLNIRNYSTQAFVAKYADVFTSANGTPAVRKTTWDEIHEGPPYLTGGPFSSVEIVRPHNTVYLEAQRNSCETWYNQPNNWSFWYDGGFYDPLWIPSLDSVPDSEYNSLGTVYSTLYPDLTNIGLGAYAKLRPTPEMSGLYVALREAKDIPRMLKTTSGIFHDIWKSTAVGPKRSRVRPGPRMAPKSAANHFLNHQFGWVPFLSDLSKFYSTYQNSLKIRTQFARDNNRWIRRRRSDKKLESDTLVYSRTDIIGCQPDGYPFSNGYSNRLYTIRLKEYTDVWYEGVFKYYRPAFNVSPDDKSYTAFDRVRQEMALYGATISPTHVWQATPWSWLVDWFSNVGDVIQAVEDLGTDQVTSKYMYLMHRRRRVFELRSQFTTIHDGRKHDYTWYRSADIKRRQPAGSPFDFTLSAGGLTGRQLAILAALGFSRT